MDDVKELPLRAGQSFSARWYQATENPSRGDMVPGLGRLVVRRDTRLLTSLSVRLESVGCSREDGPVKSATFIVLDGEGGFLERLADLTCMSCLGTGFCPECKGESLAGDCRNCLAVEGLCPECLGYGRDGDHIIASTAA